MRQQAHEVDFIIGFSMLIMEFRIRIMGFQGCIEIMVFLGLYYGS